MDANLLLDEAQRYFNSISVIYSDTKKERLGKSWLEKLSSFFIFTSLFSVIPILPAILYFSALLINKFLWPNHYFSSVLSDFRAIWVFLSGALFLLFALFAWLENRRADLFSKRLLNDSTYLFALAYDCLIELRSYELNFQYRHLENANAYLKQYLKQNRLRNLFVALSDEKEPSIGATHIKTVIEYCKNMFDWFKISDETEVIATFLKNLQEKVEQRISRKEDINILTLVFENIVIYEYAKLRKIVKQDDELGLDFRLTYLKKAADLTNALPILENIITDNKTPSFLKRVYESVSQWYRKNMIQGQFIPMLILWCIVLYPFFWGLAFSSMPFLNMELNPQIFIGLLTAPFAGAIAIVIALHKNPR